MPRYVLLTWLFLLAFTASLHPQPRAPADRRLEVGLLYGFDGFTGASKGSASTTLQDGFKLFGGGAFGIKAAYGGGRLRVGANVWYATPGVGGEDSDVAVIGKGVLDVLTLAPTVRMRVARLRGEASLTAAGSLLLERWTPVGEEGRSRIGAMGGLQLEVPLTAGLVGTIAAELGITPTSPLVKADLPAGYQPRALWRRMLVLGVSYRFW